MHHKTLIRTFGTWKQARNMKKIPFLLLLVAMLLTLTSHSPIHATYAYSAEDTTKTRQGTNKVRKDTTVAYTDTLDEISIQAEKELRVVDILNESLKTDPNTPKQKSISDVIGSKATDYIMHPFAWKQRKKEKKLKKDKEAIKKLDAAKTYEEELTEAIYRQLREDSIANAKKEQK